MLGVADTIDMLDVLASLISVLPERFELSRLKESMATNEMEIKPPSVIQILLVPRVFATLAGLTPASETGLVA